MARRHIHVPGEWIVVTDAGPTYKTPARWGPPMAIAYRVHRDSTATIPLAEGAAYIGGETGINKAEYLAVIQGLRLVADRMYVDEWARDPVNVVTDNLVVFNQATRSWNADELGWHLERLREVEELLGNMTGQQVWYFHVTDDENAEAHTLAANFSKVCDQRNRDEWERQRLLLRWQAVRQHLRDHQRRISAANLGSARVVAYTGKSLTLGFSAARADARQRVEGRRDDLREAITSVMGQALREIRCVEV